jgi:hypothetical protein
MTQQLCLARDVATLEPRAHTLSQTRLHGKMCRSDVKPFNPLCAIGAWLTDIPEGRTAML